MIKELTIKGYKGIDDGGLTLSDLAKVNYLVGENGSGKSSVLEVLYLPCQKGLNLSTKTNRIIGRDAMYRSVGDYRTVFRDNFSITINNYRRQDIDPLVYPARHVFAAQGITAKELTITSKPADSGQGTGDWYNFTYLSEVDLGMNQTYQFNIEKFDSNLEDQYVNFLNENLPEFNFGTAEEPNYVARMLIRSIEDEGDREANAITTTSQVVYGDDVKKLKKINARSLAAGYKKLIKFYFSLIQAIDTIPDDKMHFICIEEPEVSLHPTFQKLVPYIINRILNERTQKNIQFFITTHSPFIVSSAARLSKELHTPQLSEVLYGLKQKVYLLKNGKTVDLAGTAGLGQNGYEAYKATPVAAKLLGAGLNDLTNSVKSNDKVRLIYCEGENSEGDSKIYQTLFPKYNDVRNLFISAGGISGVESAFHLGKELASTLLGPNAEVLCIVDRSGEIVPCPGEVAVTDGGRAFSDEVREKWMRCTDPDGNARMLGRREIENYLYDPAVLDEYDSEWRIKLDPPLPHNFDYKLHNVKDLISKKLPDVRPMELVRKLADKGTLDIGEIHDELKASIFDYPL